MKVPMIPHPFRGSKVTYIKRNDANVIDAENLLVKRKKYE